MLARSAVPLLGLCGWLCAQIPAPAPPPPPVKAAPPATTPARITLSGGPFVPLGRPVTLRVVSSISKHDASSPGGIDWPGIDYGEVPLPEKLELIRTATAPASSPEASGVIKSATKLCGRYLKLTLPEPDSTATLTHGGEDVAVARWQFTNHPQGMSRVLLWDEPVATSLLIEMPALTLTQTAPLEEFLTSLLAWGANSLKSVWVELASPAPAAGEFLRGSGWFDIIRQIAIGSELTVSGFTDREMAWLSITFKKTIALEPFDRDMTFIAERFPPLRTRIRNWTTGELLAAIGHGGRAETGRRKAYQRSRILLDELVSRDDLSLAEFRQLVDSGAGSDEPMAMFPPGAIRAATQAKSGGRFIPEIISYFERADARRRVTAEAEARRLMYDLTQNHRADFCEVAIAFRGMALAAEDARKFISQFCTSR